MHSGRALVDYALKRHTVLAEIASGEQTVEQVCDASRYLLRAARFHGEDTDIPCPVCRRDELTYVYWIFGDSVGEMANSARPPAELEQLSARLREFTVHQVEVCRSCSWNFLIASFLMGREPTRTRARRAAR